MLFHLTYLLHPPDITLIWGAVVPLFLRGTQPPGGRWTFLLMSRQTKHSMDDIKQLQTHTHIHTNQCTVCSCYHWYIAVHACTDKKNKQMHACHTWSEKSNNKKKGDTCSKRHWFIFQSARVRSRTVKGGSITNKWTCDKKEKIPFKFALWCESFMQMEFQMRWSYLQRPWLFFHSPLLKFMPPLIYNFINSSRRWGEGSKSDETASLLSFFSKVPLSHCWSSRSLVTLSHSFMLPPFLCFSHSLLLLCGVS